MYTSVKLMQHSYLCLHKLSLNGWGSRWNVKLSIDIRVEVLFIIYVLSLSGQGWWGGGGGGGGGGTIAQYTSTF